MHFSSAVLVAAVVAVAAISCCEPQQYKCCTANSDCCTDWGKLECSVGVCVFPGNRSSLDWKPLPPAAATVDATGVKEILMELYNSTNGPAWKTATNWGVADDWCTWYGVNCDGGKFVSPVALDLKTNKLKGTLPASLASLKNLQAIIMNGNQLVGEIPPLIGSIKILQVLWLSNNQLAGSVPASLSQSHYLQYLYLENNKFTSIDAKAEPGEGKLMTTSCDLTGNNFGCPIPAWAKDPCQAKCN